MDKRRGPQGQELPDGISYDPVKRRYRVHGRHGGRTLQAAIKRKRELERQAKGISAQSLGAYIDHFEAHKQRTGRRNIERECGQLRRHVEPVLGKRRLEDVTPRDVQDLGWSLYESGLSAKTVRNVLGSLSSLYSRAIFEQLVDSNPCTQIPHGELPKAGHKPWAKYEPQELTLLLGDDRIRIDRRVLYALSFFLAERIGESCGRRFTHWDRSIKPLSCMTIDSQYDDEALKGARDDYVAARRFPVHSELQRILAWWKLSGFAEVYGRAAREDDFIVPDPRNMRARTQSQAGKALVKDEHRVGIEHKPGRATHGFRKAWISMARDGGANPDVIRALTHTGRSRDILDVYTSWPWETYCEAVQRVKLPEAAQVISLEVFRA